jgi:hypothetical protein
VSEGKAGLFPPLVLTSFQFCSARTEKERNKESGGKVRQNLTKLMQKQIDENTECKASCVCWNRAALLFGVFTQGNQHRQHGLLMLCRAIKCYFRNISCPQSEHLAAVSMLLLFLLLASVCSPLPAV